MQRRHVELWAPALEAQGVVLAYGHWGRPVLVFPSERGRAWEYETGGMVHAIAPLNCWCAGRAAGKTRPARWPARCCSPSAWPRGASATSSTWGVTTSRTTWPSWRAQIAHHLPRFC